MLAELENRKNFFLEKTPIETIYFGGGTPSLLSIAEINAFTQQIHNLFRVANHAEITLEANPDDLTESYLTALKRHTSINRLSIGIQSFGEDDLRYMNRAHNAEEALQCITLAQQMGFNNLSVDLIYGTPTLSNEQWRNNLQTVFKLNIPHLSCYALTLEKKTALSSAVLKQQKAAPLEEQIAEQFGILLEEIKHNNYLQYEISNFCKIPHFAKHNTNYWKGVPYLGIGPGAHSYDTVARYWNIDNNARYVKNITENNTAYEQEVLSVTDCYNEYIMTSIRTIYGIDIQKINATYGSIYFKHFQKEIAPFVSKKWVINTNNIFTLSDDGKLFCDYITERLFITD